MTKFLQYIGPADTREITAADLKKAGVEGGHKATYAKDGVAEIDDEATADALLTSPLFAGEFVEVESQADAAKASEPMTEKALVGNKVTSGTADATSGRGGRGANSSST